MLYYSIVACGLILIPRWMLATESVSRSDGQVTAVGLHDISHVMINPHLVSKASPVISGNFHHVHDFTWSNIYYTEPLFTDKLCKSRLIMNHSKRQHNDTHVPCSLQSLHSKGIEMITSIWNCPWSAGYTIRVSLHPYQIIHLSWGNIKNME